jgi:hypothetical protein
MAQRVAKIAPKPHGDRKVVLFNASTRIEGMSLNAGFAMLTGWSLRLQGVKVINFVCQQGMHRCVLGTQQDAIETPPPCSRCLSQSKVLYHRSDVVGLIPQSNPDLEKQLNSQTLKGLLAFCYDRIPLGEICLPSMRWILRRHHLQDDEPTRMLYRHYILSAYNVAQQFSLLLEAENPLAVVVFNGMQFPEATTRWVARQHNIPVYTHEVGIRPLSAFFTAGEATAYPVDIPETFQLNDDQNQQLDDYLSKRFKGDFSMAGIAFWPEMQGLDQALTKKIESFRHVVPIFTNVIFDTSQPHANTVFEDMFTWLDVLLEVVRNHPETLFVIRAHPDESRVGKASRESVTDWVRERNAESLLNLVFIGPDSYFSSYEMIQRAKFVMIYNSTIGMEASIMGKPVVCAGKARFTQLETVFFPKTVENYMRTLEGFLKADVVEAPPAHRINARRFLYYQLFRTSLPFDRFLEPDGIWPGFVRLKDFSIRELLSEKSITLRVIAEGILEGKDFLLPES